MYENPWFLGVLAFVLTAGLAAGTYRVVRPRLARWRVQRQLPALAAQARLNVAHLGTWDPRYQRPKGL
ncbi:MAG TPA: hypothetical protein VD862_02250 [Candidatus Paceibacterota bacterium]|nr:hypothetical protein [Candidatus Paceibacterota bacterium]